MFMGEVASLLLPVHQLGRGNGDGLKSKGLNRIVQDQTDRIEEDVRSLIMLKIEGGRPVFNLIQNGV